MHLITATAAVAALRAEIENDPTGRGYDGKSVSEIVALLNAPVVAPPSRVDVLISDVKGYLARRLVIVRMRRQVTDLTGDIRDVAEALLDILHDTQMTRFFTADATKRAGVLGMFAMLVQAGVGGLTQDHYNEIEAMTIAPAGSGDTSAPRWAIAMSGISGEEGHPGPPNAASEALVAEALNG